VPLIIDQNETRWLIRAEGEVLLNGANELKNLLLDGLASGKQLAVDLTQAEEIDVTLLQLLWAAEQHPAWMSGPIVNGLSDAAARAAQGAGFERFPGTGDSGASLG